MLGALSERYDFRRAKIVETVAETTGEGPLRGTPSVRITAEVPSIAASKPPLLVRIRLFFRKVVTEPVRLAVQAAVNRVLGKAVAGLPARVQPGEAPAAQKILMDVKRDLKSLHIPEAEHVDWDIEVTADFGDFLVSEAGFERSSRHA
jgi:hypothetical protein